MNINDIGAGQVSRAFALVDIAEEEMARAGRSREPGLFMRLRPPAILVPLVPKLYRAHVRELLGRSKPSEDATGPMILAALAEMSLQAPLAEHALWLYWTEFDKVFPGREPEPSASAWAREEALAMRAKLSRSFG